MTKKNTALLSLAIFLTIIVSSYRAFSFPYDYFAPQYFLNYQDGFIKRGFIGTINLLIFRDASYQYNSIVILATILLVILFFLIYYIYSKTSLNNKITWIPFLASPGFFYLLNANGSLDIPCYILALFFGIYCKHREKHKLLLLSIFGIISLLIHEGSLLTSIPLMLFFYYSTEKNWSIERSKEFIFTILLLVFCSILISHLGIIDAKEKQALFINAQLKADFPPTYYPFYILDHNISDNIFTAYIYYFQSNRFVAIFYCIALTLPLLFISIRQTKENKIIIFLFCYTPPLLMHLIATDYMRWSAFSLFNIFIAFIFSRTNPINSDKKAIYSFACLLIAIFYFYAPYPVRSGELRELSDLSATKSNIERFIQHGPKKPENPHPDCQKKLPNGLWCTFSKIKE